MQDFAWWLNTFIGEAGEKLGGKDKEAVIEQCGRVCFQSSNITGAISVIKKKTNDLGELLSELNKAGIGGGNLHMEGDTISGVYEKCYCPYRNALGESITPEFCNCTFIVTLLFVCSIFSCTRPASRRVPGLPTDDTVLP